MIQETQKTDVCERIRCERCDDGPLQHEMHIPAALGERGYRIFRCLACGYVQWVAEPAR